MCVFEDLFIEIDITRLNGKIFRLRWRIGSNILLQIGNRNAQHVGPLQCLVIERAEFAFGIDYAMCGGQRLLRRLEWFAVEWEIEKSVRKKGNPNAPDQTNLTSSIHPPPASSKLRNASFLRECKITRKLQNAPILSSPPSELAALAA